jgi:hypothetical protein
LLTEFRPRSLFKRGSRWSVVSSDFWSFTVERFARGSSRATELPRSRGTGYCVDAPKTSIRYASVGRLDL